MIKVFLVEDSTVLQVAMEGLLEGIGGLALAGKATGERKAKEWLELHGSDWDIAILDLMLLDGSGFEMIRQCRAAHAAADIVVFSAMAYEPVAQRCRALGADVVIAKHNVRKLVDYLSGRVKAARSTDCAGETCPREHPSLERDAMCKPRTT